MVQSFCSQYPSHFRFGELNRAHLFFTYFLSDPVVASLAQDIFKELAQIEACQGPMQMRLIPTLVSIMQAPPDKIPSGLCAVSAVNCLSLSNTRLLFICIFVFILFCDRHP